ncbi:hypothetical protein [Thermogemmatispora carboxidivorans]|uniref:hypothetical protein n=1 Tax=Thermogemmatispora carboxidivorans TaxID=1382306 RepID=UPI00069A0AB3|nr:hypothetical protein [Thermogemmatispora carboxidivorans]
MILEAVIPVLSVGLLVTLFQLVREIQLSVKTWRARRQRQQARQVAATGLVEAKALRKRWGLAVLTALVIAFVPVTRVSADSAPQPDQTVQTTHGVVKKYSLAKLRKTPGIAFVTAKTLQQKASSVAARAVAPDATASSGNYLLIVTASLVWVYWDNSFLCGYGLGGAEASPWTATVDEQGDLYVNGNWKDGTATTDWTATSGETGCWSFASNTLWEWYVSGAAQFWWGPTLWTEADVWAWQP